MAAVQEQKIFAESKLFINFAKRIQDFRRPDKLKLESNTNRYQIFRPTAGNMLGTLFISFFVMLVVVGFLQGIAGSVVADRRTSFLIGATIQSLLLFIFPAWLMVCLCTARPAAFLGMDRNPGIKPMVGVMLFMILVTPALNWLVQWNSLMTLPESMSALESTLRQWEEAAARTTDMVLSDSSVWGLVSGVLILGCLTGFAEEMFFRAGIQKALTVSGVNVHVTVWTAAFIFSAVHFQFFGFVPRLVLGASFGYFYYYTSSLWVSAFAHALNNSVVVITAWLTARGYLSAEFDKIGTGVSGDAWLAVASMLLTAAFLFLLGRRLFDSNRYRSKS